MQIYFFCLSLPLFWWILYEKFQSECLSVLKKKKNLFLLPLPCTWVAYREAVSACNGRRGSFHLERGHKMSPSAKEAAHPAEWRPCASAFASAALLSPHLPLVCDILPESADGRFAGASCWCRCLCSWPTLSWSNLLAYQLMSHWLVGKLFWSLLRFMATINICLMLYFNTNPISKAMEKNASCCSATIK